ncbi:MAG TPA: Gfo/Idh/MocA family oxidoreductase [Tepidisphaeraceae bacterium]|nr:Gfo/Idh/MocA family oxidoreductase [Tepidisphaeraceae bacterium]
MAQQIRVGIIGCGQIAQVHFAQYAKMSPDDVKVVAAADIDEGCARRSAEKFGVAEVYTDFRKLLERDDIDAVDVCLHNNFHRPATEAALRAGKHVYCEKPMAGSYRDAASMLETARQAGRKLSIQLSTLYANETRAAKELIDAGELGELYFARSTGWRRRGRPYVDGYGTPTFVQKRNSAGGALYDMGVYHISQVLYLLGNPTVARVSGKTYQKTDMDPQRRQASGYDVEELGLGLVRFQGDVTLDLIEAWAIHLDAFEGSYVVGSKGGVRLQPFGFFRSSGHMDLSSTADLERSNFRWTNVAGDHAHYAGPQPHWIAALQGKVDLLPTAEIALNTMLISEAIYLSNDRRAEVTAQEVAENSKSTAVGI